jgi:hypothetical protein
LFTQSITTRRLFAMPLLDSTRHIGDFAGARRNSRQRDYAEEYTFYSIVQPSRYMVRGFSNVMYNEFAARLTPQDIADLCLFTHFEGFLRTL